ncbi:MAG: GNAT family N-acetyltransferase [Anaerolineales bacterium]|nr:GNAT family N-acetyltransferase [Anaerolineales bacterium]
MNTEMKLSVTLFQGELVRLTAADPQTTAEAFSRWSRDSEYWRLLASDPCLPHSVKAIKQWLEKDQEKDPLPYTMFLIHTLEDDRLIGDIGLEGYLGSHGDTFVGIGLGEREYWGKGYGTDAMRIILRYAFFELNLERVSLDVFEYNPRAIRSYERAGFKHEGRLRGYLNRGGKRYDLIFMGILRAEWLEIYGK